MRNWLKHMGHLVFKNEDNNSGMLIHLSRKKHMMIQNFSIRNAGCMNIVFQSKSFSM